jgi:hypothetical protein
MPAICPVNGLSSFSHGRYFSWEYPMASVLEMMAQFLHEKPA